MANVKLTEPSPKSNVSVERKLPFPIPLKDESSQFGSKSSVINKVPQWNYYTAYLKMDGVEVTDEESMKTLYSMGFFGKGTLSKRGPIFNKSYGEEGEPPVMSQRRYLRHMEEKQKACRERRENRKSHSSSYFRCRNDEDRLGFYAGSSSIPSTSKRSRSSSDEEEIREEYEKPSKLVRVVDDEKRNLLDQDEDSDIERCSTPEGFVAEDPWPITETLQLTFEEAFFLSYGLGCLIVKDKDKSLDLIEMWKKFCELSVEGRFPVTYTAYHYFRSKGWVVRSGLKYGVDFLLYKDGPPFYHGTYSVLVKSVRGKSFREVIAFPDRPLTWTSVAALNRVNEHVAKEILFCNVIHPDDMTQDDMLDPRCIPNFKIQEILLRRWVSTEGRVEET